MSVNSETSATQELRIAVVTPTRLQRIGGAEDGELFVERAMRSALARPKMRRSSKRPHSRRSRSLWGRCTTARWIFCWT